MTDRTRGARSTMRFSVIVPARDEETRIGACLDSIRAAAAAAEPLETETIVVLNRCRDRTEEIARSRGARIVREDAKNLSKIRNAGARAARGEILVTVDADSTLSPRMLTEVDRALKTGRYVGGGVPIVPERISPGILLTGLALMIVLYPYGVPSAGAFWCRREDFEAIGGFDETRVLAEDVDFARRLRRYGRQRGLRYGTLRRAPIRTSCRKFDAFGDWYFLRRPSLLRKGLRGTDRPLADRIFYEFEHDSARRSDA